MKLTREQIKKLRKITKEYKTADEFQIMQSNDSGIGTTTKVTFYVADQWCEVDISDYENW